MPKFDVTGKDGKSYEIDAPDAQSALNAFNKYVGANASAAGGVVDGIKRNAEGKIDVLDALQKQMGTGQYAPPAPAQPDLSNNPLNSSLPGPLGQLDNTFRAATQGAQQGVMLNLGDEAYAAAAAPFRAAYDASQGNGFDLGRAFQYDQQQAEQRDQQLQQLNPTAYGVGQFLGSLGLMGKAREPMALPSITPAGVGRAALTGAVIGGASGAGEPGSLQERGLNALQGAGVGGILGAVGGKFATGMAREAVPTVAELKGAAKAGFRAAEGSGAVVSQKVVADFANANKSVLQQEGLITPSGKVAAFPKVAHGLDMLDEFSRGDMTIAQAKTVRKALASAAKSIDPEERYQGVQLLDRFDKFMEQLRPADFVAGNGQQAVNSWAKARSLYATAKKGESVEGLIDAAQRKSRKSTAVPVEQSLRNQFDKFTSNPRNLRGFSQAERDALQNVSEGTRGGNIAKAVGKLAPTTLGGLVFKASVPFGVGSYVGGPMVGGALAAGTIGLGTVGRVVSTLSTKHQAELARLIVLNGGVLPKKVPAALSEPVKRAVGNLILMGGANGPEIGNIVIRQIAPQSAQRPAQ